MRMAVARALMTLARSCFGQRRREWASAMQAEFGAAVEDGNALSFAAGCLIAAWREMPRQEQGRFVLANYVLALGVLLPVAVLEIGPVIGFIHAFPDQPGLGTMLVPTNLVDPYLAEPQRNAVPALLGLWLLLAGGHLCLAWAVLERNWPRVIRIGALVLAASTTLLIFAGVLFLDYDRVGLQAALLAVELVAITLSARWHAKLFPGTSSEAFAS